jgi:hypothetical protein
MSGPEGRALAVNLILHDNCRGWIIEKMALKLCAALRELGVDAQVSATALPAPVVNHFMIFHYVEAQTGVLNTMAVTHVDDALKVDMIRRHLARGVRAAICMSSMTLEQLAQYGVCRQQLTYALPAHDGEIAPRRLVIGITSNRYSDGRKRDWLLTRLAEDVRLSDFEFQIFGRGWDDVAPKLKAAGADVAIVLPSDDYLADYERIREAVPNFDYYFYPGLDEGSMGTLDALAAGVKTIITRQGFHLDLPAGITHGFWGYDELKSIFETIIAERAVRIETANALSWRRYAARHMEIWTSLLRHDSLPPADLIGGLLPEAPPASFPVEGYAKILANPYRREMTLRFWAPGLLDGYRSFRMRLGRALRRSRAGVA